MCRIWKTGLLFFYCFFFRKLGGGCQGYFIIDDIVFIIWLLPLDEDKRRKGKKNIKKKWNSIVV
jgi:hypothetical protein